MSDQILSINGTKCEEKELREVTIDVESNYCNYIFIGIADHSKELQIRIIGQIEFTKWVSYILLKLFEQITHRIQTFYDGTTTNWSE